jgi:flavin-dependent dehydrogenase
MASQAEAAGAQLMWGRDYRGAQRRGTQFRVTGETLSAPFLVGADGVFSRVARDFGLGRNRRFLYGAEVELEGVRDLDATRLHCFLTREFAPGYIGWAVPGVGATQIGLAGRAPFRPRLEEFLTRLRRVFNLDRARALSHRHGWIPAGGPVSPARAPGVLLIGDAAGHVSPLTAGGIRLALERGASVADEIADQIQGRPHPAPPPPSFAIKRILREALEHAFPDAAAEALLTSLLFRQTALRLLFG